MSLGKLGANLVKRDDGGAENVQDMDVIQLLLAMLTEMRMQTFLLREMSGIDVEPSDLQLREI